jgi:hypothetical protein
VFTASDGGGLGEEKSKSIQLTLHFKPFERPHGKDARLLQRRTRTGPSMGGIVQGWRNDTCTGKQIATEGPGVPDREPADELHLRHGARVGRGDRGSNGSRNVITP